MLQLERFGHGFSLAGAFSYSIQVTFKINTLETVALSKAKTETG
jgi:hypothetical protein